MWSLARSIAEKTDHHRSVQRALETQFLTPVHCQRVNIKQWTEAGQTKRAMRCSTGRAHVRLLGGCSWRQKHQGSSAGL
jgi:hypothetical protein